MNLFGIIFLSILGSVVVGSFGWLLYRSPSTVLSMFKFFLFAIPMAMILGTLWQYLMSLTTNPWLQCLIMIGSLFLSFVCMLVVIANFGGWIWKEDKNKENLTNRKH